MHCHAHKEGSFPNSTGLTYGNNNLIYNTERAERKSVSVFACSSNASLSNTARYCCVYYGISNVPAI